MSPSLKAHAEGKDSLTTANTLVKFGPIDKATILGPVVYVPPPEPPIVTQAKKTRSRANSQVKTTPASGLDYGGAVIVLDSGRKEYRNCVSTVRLFHDYPSGGNPYGTPININSRQPAIGAVAVQSHHVMIVVDYTETTLTIKEGNFRAGYLTQRVIPRSSVLGYWL